MTESHALGYPQTHHTRCGYHVIVNSLGFINAKTGLPIAIVARAPTCSACRRGFEADVRKVITKSTNPVVRAWVDVQQAKR